MLKSQRRDCCDGKVERPAQELFEAFAHTLTCSFIKHIFSMHGGLGIVREQGVTGIMKMKTLQAKIPPTHLRAAQQPSYAVCIEGLGHEGLRHMGQGKGYSQLNPASLTRSVPKPTHHCHSATESQLQCSISSGNLKPIGKIQKI